MVKKKKKFLMSWDQAFWLELKGLAAALLFPGAPRYNPRRQGFSAV